MRWTVLSLFVVFVFNYQGLKAQDTLHAGFHLAYNQTNVIAQNYFEKENQETLGGVGLGFYALFEINKSLSLRPGLSFAQKGYQVDYGKKDFQARFSYFKLPVMGRLNFELGKPTFFAQVGPYLGYLLSADESGVRPNSSGLEEAKDFIEVDGNATKNFKYGDFGLKGGVGLRYPFKAGELTLEINYNEGFVNIARKNPDEQLVKNKAFQIAIGYLTTFQ